MAVPLKIDLKNRVYNYKMVFDSIIYSKYLHPLLNDFPSYTATVQDYQIIFHVPLIVIYFALFLLVSTMSFYRALIFYLWYEYHQHGFYYEDSHYLTVLKGDHMIFTLNYKVVYCSLFVFSFYLSKYTFLYIVLHLAGLYFEKDKDLYFLVLKNYYEEYSEKVQQYLKDKLPAWKLKLQ